MRKAFFLFVGLLTYSLSFTQQFGGHPPSTQWKQLNTDTVRVIFPSGLQLEKQAADIANTASRLGRQTNSTIGDRIRKVSIVLQPRTTVSNGYVGLGPWRSEFMLTPPQSPFELGSLPWYHSLALHEYRHVQQYNNFRKGISKAFYYLFGQEGLALATSAAVPNWFWEGDAVMQETTMSQQGRGRIPFFFNDYRSLWAAGKDYSWLKLRNGSLRDFVPNHYRLGYMMVAYGNEKYGSDFWKKVTNDAVRYKGLFYPWQQAVKKYSGVGYPTFRRNAFDHFASYVKPDSVGNWAQQQKHFVADEEFPQWVSDREVVLVKSSYKKIPAFYLYDLNTGEQRRLRTKDISVDNYFSYRNGKIVYAGFEPDIRWNWKDYSVLKVLDLQSGEQRTITHRTQYFAPDISDDGKTLVAVEVQPGGHANLHLLDAVTGQVTKQVPNPDKLFYSHPRFYKNNQVVCAVRSADGTMTLALVDLQNGAVKALLPWSMNTVGFPAVQGDTITFTGSQGEQEQLYAFAENRLYQLEINNAGTGNYQWSARNGKAIWTAFTAVGYHLMQQSYTAWKPADFSAKPFSYNLKTLQQGPDVAVDTTHPTKPTHYSKSFRLINFHSWRPFISDPDYTFSLVGENILNTLQTEVYFNYNTNEEFKELGASLIYGGWFPLLSLSAARTFDRQQPDSPFARTWNETNVRLGLQLPFTFTSGRYYRNLTFSTGFNTRQVNFTGLSKNRFNDPQFYFVDGSLALTMQSQVARQQIYPQLGNSFLARVRTAVNDVTARQLLLNDNIYLPGIAPTHSLVLNVAYQARDTMQEYFFGNSFPTPRGYPNFDQPRMVKLGANYHFPLVYPDWGFGSIVYFLRLRANAYYDYASVKTPDLKRNVPLSSAGGELFFDTKWWNEYPVSFGIRYSRLLNQDRVPYLSPNQWEFILPVNLLGR